MEKPRTIEDVCKTRGIYFQVTHLNKNYCALAYHRKIACKHLGKKVQEHVYSCKLERELEFMKN